jgi:HEAT repeat protein
MKEEEGLARPVRGKRVAAVLGISVLAMAGAGTWLARDAIASVWWVRKLESATGHEDAIRAIEALGKLRSERAIPAIVEAVRRLPHVEPRGGGGQGESRRRKDPERVWEETFAAATRAIAAAGRRAVPAMVRGLGDRDQDIHDLSSCVLAALGPDARDALSVLQAMARDPACEGQFDAVLLLGKIGPAETIVPVLLELLEGSAASEWLETHIAEALGSLGPPARGAIPALRRLADSPAFQVRDAVREAIGKIEGRG